MDCRARWRMSKSPANRLIDAAGAAQNPTPVGVKPESERQARLLALPAPEP